MGRPSKYTEAVAEQINSRMMQGESLRSICADAKMPSLATVCNWLAAGKEPFLEQYTRAREIQAELMADDIVGIADRAKNKDDAPAKKLQMDARMWVASKLLPKKYGENKELKLTGDKDNPIQTRAVIEIIPCVIPIAGSEKDVDV